MIFGSSSYFLHTETHFFCCSLNQVFFFIFFYVDILSEAALVTRPFTQTSQQIAELIAEKSFRKTTGATAEDTAKAPSVEVTVDFEDF